MGKVNPPLRSSEDIEDLWTATSCGFFDTIGTDHVVTSSATQSTDNVWDSTPGFASLGMPLPVLITYGVDKGRLSWQQVAKLCSEDVARVFGIYPRKGILNPGSDADFIIVDPAISWKVDHKDWLTASEFCIFDGMEMKGKVIQTYVRGRKVGENMQPVGQKGTGKFVEPVL
jgi:dihydroorotase-like cyclic amidohydrolase